MDANERLLSQVLEERSAHGRFRGPGSSWLLTAGLIVAVIVVGTVLRMAGSSGVGGVPAPRTQPVETTAPSGAAPQDNVGSGAQPVATAASVQGSPRRYVVQPGDSLESIAAQSGLSPATLASVNQLDNPDLLQPGNE
ncbi:MAG TPA: LysM peptidoglycan-binding domain-containing protein, partial [Chloroflexota bacterium]